MATTVLKIYRFDPAVDNEPYYTSYEVPWKDYLTVLQGIHYINENIEPIAFDYSCRGSLCGRCACMVNGSAALACWQTLEADKEYTIEPLNNFPVVRDLFVDKSTFVRGLDDTDLSVNTVKSLKKEDLPALEYNYYWEHLERLNQCRECGNCAAVCPIQTADPVAYAGPAAFGQMYLRANDKLDQTDRVFQAVMGGVFRCIECGRCDNVCPAYIQHVEHHKELQQAAIDAEIVPANYADQLA